MPLTPPITNLPITTERSGFYTFNRFVRSKVLNCSSCGPPYFRRSRALSQLNSWLLGHFHWYMYVVFFYIVVCLGLAVWPQSGRIKFGMPDEKPEFSRFSWFSMMFGAGIGIGMLTFATAEIYHFGNNPDVIQGLPPNHVL